MNNLAPEDYMFSAVDILICKHNNVLSKVCCYIT